MNNPMEMPASKFDLAVQSVREKGADDPEVIRLVDELFGDFERRFDAEFGVSPRSRVKNALEQSRFYRACGLIEFAENARQDALTQAQADGDEEMVRLIESESE